MQKTTMKDPAGDRLLYALIYLALAVIFLLVLYPIVYIISASFSSPIAVTTGRVTLWPVDFGLQGYKAVFSHKRILTGYRNTIFYTALGTSLNVAITLMAAYPLSRRDFPLRKPAMALFTFTMFFSGGMIPSYILVVQLGLINTVWALVLPGALSVYNMILLRTSMMNGIPGEMLEAAQIDGCDDTQYFFRILLPLSRPTIAVITLFYAVAHWNAYFNAMLYLSEQDMYPLQLVLRDILVANSLDLSEIQDPELLSSRQGMADLLKYALIVISSAPIIALYPLVQKHFVKGVMIGSVKG